MSDEIELCDAELHELVAELERGISQLEKLEGPVKAERLEHLHNRLTRAKQVYHGYRVEMRELSERDMSIYESKAKGHNESLNRLQAELQFHKQGNDRADLLHGAAAGGVNPDHLSAGELVTQGLDVQKDSKNRLDRSKRVVAQTTETAANTAAVLNEQTDQLRRIGEGVDQVESNLKRADRELRMFIRRMATDKFILGFLFLIVLGVVFMIVWKITHPKEEKLKDWWNEGKESASGSAEASSAEGSARFMTTRFG
eukprot:TRINITY_DN3260_c0_g1_i1.p1 TRINITY_DN3260_c0_g1~~TRINITY_DN3260_c0_g1_i1.p1  ORF type:complete len:256 (+),score=85.01 TRINITY_DN3260_c0_g1_i1:122-889(+)